MSTKSTHQITKVIYLILTWILLLICLTNLLTFVESRNLDETTVPSTTGGVKCTPCGDYPSPPPPIVYPSPPPPPPLVYPSPPPPIIYLSPPPPPPKKPPSVYCPPPPRFPDIDITGPPGNLYPVDENFTAASPRRHPGTSAFLPLMVGLLVTL